MKNKTKLGFSLLEVVIAMTIFAFLAVMTVMIFTNTSKMSRKIEVQEYVFTEAEAAMEKILREIQRSTVDYEEYYSWLVLEAEDYGENYGAYGATFYDPGTGGPVLTPNFGGGDGADGLDCDEDDEYFFGMDCLDLVDDTYDTDTGEHYAGNSDRANAFCEACDLEVGDSSQSELYLIDGVGERKVFFALEDKENGEKVISMLVMEGDDVDMDGISDYWGCSDDYVCVDALADLSDASIEDDDFEPITPGNLDVIALDFYIAPLEDPYRAFAEEENAILQHPHVIVVMTVAPSEDLTKGLLGADWTLTLQGMASASVFDVVPSEYRGAWRW